MAESTGLSAADVVALTRDNDSFFGEGLWGVILLLIVAGVIGGNGFFGGNAAVAAGLTRAELDSEFVQRDIFNTNTSVLENRYASSMGECQTQREVLENRYASQLGVQSILSNQAECCCENKTLALQNKYELAQLADRNNFNMLLGNKDLTAEIAAEGEKTRALIIAQNEARMLEKINDLKAQVNNQEQSAYILSQLGRFHAYPSCGNVCGCNCGSNLI